MINKEISIRLYVDLINNKINFKNKNFWFNVNDLQRFYLLNDVDNIDLTMEFNNKIKLYKSKNTWFF